MHVPWAWIKQRPHFIAEYLNKDYDLKVVYKKPLKVSKNNLINKKSIDMSISSFFIFPFQRIPLLRKMNILNKINDILIKFQLRFLNNYSIVWVTSWSMYSLIYKLLPETTKLIYDCMDDELEFPNIKNNKYILKTALLMEKKILNRADVVFCSSEYLKNKILNRTGINREIYVINNAIGIPKQSIVLNSNSQNIMKIISNMENIFMYVGAISTWFDFELLLYVLQNNLKVNFVLLGPSDIQIPKHERLHYLGTVDREDLFLLMKNVKGLIMPFKLNELIKSVNPVKLYEYIYMSKPIIATRYSETEFFEDYIYLYQGKKEFCDCIEGILEYKLRCKKKTDDNKKFAINNSWGMRYELILKYI
jgi:glycosyltransferase involved in cell wall biosynthesis